MAETNDRKSDHPGPALLGCVADDVTGATDMAINLVQGGMRVVQFLTVPTATQLNECDCDAIVVALKTRSIDPAEAIRQTLAAVEALEEYGCQRFFFKYCSTFDSTPKGNIGPVADALLDHLQAEQTIACPAFPRTGRTVYQGHLFVNGMPLNESGMQHHPLNPMTDSNLCRWLEQQTRNNVGLVDYSTVAKDADAIRGQLKRLRGEKFRFVVADCCGDEHLTTIAEAVADMPLVTGGSGIGRYLPEAWRKTELLEPARHEPRLPCAFGRGLVLAGSCSQATQRQVANLRPDCDTFRVNVSQLMQDDQAEYQRFESWLERNPGDEGTTVLVYSTSDNVEVSALQERYGRTEVCGAIESFHASVAKNMIARHAVRRLIVAGGETAGAVVDALGIDKLEIGPEICAGVPWTSADAGTSIALALKSGNFGDDDFFRTALEMLP
jgi:uncharacterized protein YgbK (DUF1537 family)